MYQYSWLLIDNPSPFPVSCNASVSGVGKSLQKSSSQSAITCSKLNNKNTRTRCEICSKLPIKTPERGYWRRSGVFIVNFKYISHFVLVFLLLTLSS